MGELLSYLRQEHPILSFSLPQLLEKGHQSMKLKSYFSSINRLVLELSAFKVFTGV